MSTQEIPFQNNANKLAEYKEFVEYHRETLNYFGEYLPKNIKHSFFEILNEHIKYISESYKLEIKELHEEVKKQNITRHHKSESHNDIKFVNLSDRLKDSMHYSVESIMDGIQKIYPKLEDEELSSYLIKFLVINGYENSKLNSVDVSVLKDHEILKKSSSQLLKRLKDDFKNNFKKDIDLLDLNLNEFVEISHQIEETEAPHMIFINPKINKANFNTLYHELDSGNIIISKVISPGLQVNNRVFLRAVVEAKIISKSNKFNGIISGNDIKIRMENDISSNPETQNLNQLYRIVCESIFHKIIENVKQHTFDKDNLYSFMISYFILGAKKNFFDTFDDMKYWEKLFEIENKNFDKDPKLNDFLKKIKDGFIDELKMKFEFKNEIMISLEDINEILKLILMISTFKPKISWINPDVSKKVLYNTQDHKTDQNISVKKVITPGIKINGFVVSKAEVYLEIDK
jgi:hypothetical protein